MVLEVIERGRSDGRRGLSVSVQAGSRCSSGGARDREDVGRARPGTEPRLAYRSRDRLDREPADFAGLPVVIDGSVQMAHPLARRLASAGNGCCFSTS